MLLIVIRMLFYFVLNTHVPVFTDIESRCEDSSKWYEHQSPLTRDHPVMTQDDRRLTEAGQRLKSAEMDIEVSSESVTEHTHYCCTHSVHSVLSSLYITIQYSVHTLTLLHRHLGIFSILRYSGIIATGDVKKKTLISINKPKFLMNKLYHLGFGYD